MEHIHYNGMEIEEFNFPQIFKKPLKLYVWSYNQGKICNFHETEVVAILPKLPNHANIVCLDDGKVSWANNCGVLFNRISPRRATNKELAQWLAQGNGQRKDVENYTHVLYNYYADQDNNFVPDGIMIRKWGDSAWRFPTIDYMGIKEENEK